MAMQIPLVIHAQGNGRDFQQCIGLRVKAACLYIDNNGQKAAKALRHGRIGIAIIFRWIHWFALSQLQLAVMDERFGTGD